MAGSLFKRGNTWFVRFGIPEARQADVGLAMGAKGGRKREIVRTLETTDHAVARGRRDQALSAIRADVEAALSQAKKRPLSNWKADWQGQALRLHEELKALGDRVAYWDENPNSGEMEPTYAADEHMDHVREEARDLEGRYGRTVAHKFMEIAKGGGMTIAQAIERWLSEERAKVKAGTILSHEAAFKRLGAYLSSHEALPGLESVLLSDVSRRIAGEFIQDRRAVAASETVSRDFSAFSGLWRWAIRRGYAEVNPWTDQTAGLKALRATEKERKQERAYTDAELVKLLRAGREDLAPLSGGYAATFWDVIRLALLTGARAGEILGLNIGDIIEGGTVAVLAAGGRGKTDSAPRIMPLHPLAQRVVRDRLACLPEQDPEASLWPEVPPTGVDQRRSKIIGNRYPTIRRRVLGDSDEVDFHSYRRSFLTACETAMHHGGRLNGQLIALLVGHKREALAFDLYSDWSRLGRVAMQGQLGERLGLLRAAVEDVVALGLGEGVRGALEETQGDRPPMGRVKPAFRRNVPR